MQYKIIYGVLYVEVYEVNVAITRDGGSDAITHSPYRSTVVAGPIAQSFRDVTLSATSINANGLDMQQSHSTTNT